MAILAGIKRMTHNQHLERARSLLLGKTDLHVGGEPTVFHNILGDTLETRFADNTLFISYSEGQRENGIPDVRIDIEIADGDAHAWLALNGGVAVTGLSGMNRGKGLPLRANEVFSMIGARNFHPPRRRVRRKAAAALAAPAA